MLPTTIETKIPRVQHVVRDVVVTETLNGVALLAFMFMLGTEQRSGWRPEQLSEAVPLRPAPPMESW